MLKKRQVAQLPSDIHATLGDFLINPGADSPDSKLAKDAHADFLLDPLFTLSDNAVIDSTAYFFSSFPLSWTEDLKKRVERFTRGRMLWDIIPNLNGQSATKDKILVHKRVTSSGIPLETLKLIEANFLPVPVVLALLSFISPNASSSEKIPLCINRECCLPVLIGDEMSVIRVTFMKTVHDARWSILSPEPLKEIPRNKVLLLQSQPAEGEDL